MATWTDAALVEAATGIVMGRRGCSLGEAFALLIDAANAHDMSVSDLAMCMLADQQLR